MRDHEPAVIRQGGLGALDGAVAVALAVAAALWSSSFHVVPTATGTWRGISDAPSAARIAASAVFGLVAAWGLSRFPPSVRRPMVALAAAALPLAPVLAGTLRPLLVIQGDVLRLLAGAVLAVTGVRLAAVRGVRIGHAPAALLFASAFLFYCAWAGRVPGAAGPQGDEPHYLVMAQSLLSDGDLDLTDEFSGREYALFYGGDLAPHTSPNTPRGRLYSMHSPGLPALLVPAYALGGYRGARVLHCALAALTGVLLYRLVRDVTGDERIAAATWTLATFTPPLPFYAVSLYPETLAALAIVTFLLTARATPGAATAAIATLLAMALPWVHTKFIPLAGAGLVFTALRAFRWRVRAAMTGAYAVSLLLLSGYFRSLYASPSWTAALGPADVSLGRAPWGLAGTFFDRQYGLFIVAPLLILAIPGGIVLWQRRTGDALRAVVLVVLVAVPAAAYVGWWGGAAPPARYVLPVVGPMLLAVAMVALRARDALAALGGIGVTLLGLAAEAPRMLRNRPDGESLLLRSLSPDIDLNAWLPSFVEGGSRGPILAASLLAAAAIAWHWRGRGVILGLVGYVLVANGLRDRPLVDRAAATQRLLWAADDATNLLGLAVPFELPRRPWTLEPGEGRNSRRILLPPGAYRVHVRARAPAGASRARIEIHAGDLSLAEAEIADEETAVLPLLLPAGGRGVGVSAFGIAGRAEIDEVAVVPEALVPRARRAAFEWPELPTAASYRVASSGVRVTVLDRTAPEADGFRVRGAGSFLVEAPVGATVRMTVRHAGAASDEEADLGTADGVPLGRTAVLPVHVAATDALVIFGIRGR